MPSIPKLEELMHFRIEAGPGLPPIADPAGGMFQHFPVTAATLTGPGFVAELAAPAGDALRFLADGYVEPNVALMLRTSAGAVIAMRYRGLAAPGPAQPDPDWPIRMTARFMTGDPDLGWLGRAIFVGAGRMLAHDEQGSRAEYRIFRLA